MRLFVLQWMPSGGGAQSEPIPALGKQTFRPADVRETSKIAANRYTLPHPAPTTHATRLLVPGYELWWHSDALFPPGLYLTERC